MSFPTFAEAFWKNPIWDPPQMLAWFFDVITDDEKKTLGDAQLLMQRTVLQAQYEFSKTVMDIAAKYM